MDEGNRKSDNEIEADAEEYVVWGRRGLSRFASDKHIEARGAC